MSASSTGAEGLQGCGGRRRVGIVGVVEHHHAIRQPLDPHAHSHRRPGGETLHDGQGIDPQCVGHPCRRTSIQRHMSSRCCQLHFDDSGGQFQGCTGHKGIGIHVGFQQPSIAILRRSIEQEARLVGARHGAHPGVIRVHHQQIRRACPIKQLLLASRHTRQVPHSFGVGQGHVGDQAHVGPRDLLEAPDLPRAAHSHFKHQHPGLRRHGQQGQGQAHVVVEVPGGRMHRPHRLQNRLDHGPGRGLSGGARHRNNRTIHPVPDRRGAVLQGAKGVRNHQHAAHPVLRGRVHNHSRTTRRRRRLQEGMSIEVLPTKGEKPVPGLQGSGVGVDSPRRCIPKQVPTGGDCHVPGRENHDAPRSASASAATTRSSNSTRSPRISWYCSCPFPAMSTTSPGSAHSTIARRIANARST